MSRMPRQKAESGRWELQRSRRVTYASPDDHITWCHRPQHLTHLVFSKFPYVKKIRITKYFSINNKIMLTPGHFSLKFLRQILHAFTWSPIFFPFPRKKHSHLLVILLVHKPRSTKTIAVVFNCVNGKFNDYTYKLAVFAVKHFPKVSPASHSDLIIHNTRQKSSICFDGSSWASGVIQVRCKSKMEEENEECVPLVQARGDTH